MTSANAKKIPIADADSLIMQSDRIHVVEIKTDGQEKQFLWSRDKVIEALVQHGAFVAGARARSSHHGIATRPDKQTWWFFETGHS